MRSMRLLIMAWFFMVGVIGTGLVGPNRLAVRQQYGLSETRFGVGFAVIQVTASLGVLLAAHWLTRLRPVAILMSGMAAVVGGFLLISVSSSVWLLAAGWMAAVAGMTLGMITNNISMDLWPHNPRRGLVMLHSFNAGGKMAGPLVAASFLALSYRLSFTAVGAAMLVVLVVCAALKRHGDAATASTELVDPGSGLRALRKGSFWFFVVMIGSIAGGEVAFATLLPTFLVKVRGMSEQMASVFFTVHLAGLTAGRFASAFLGERVSNDRMIALCLLCGLGVVPAILSGSTAVILVSLALLGVMFSSTWPSYYALSVGRLAAQRDMMPYGSAMGCYLVSSVCVVISSMIADVNLTAAMLFGPGVLAVFGLAHLLDRRFFYPAVEQKQP